MNLANWITSTRFIIAPLVFWQLATQTPNGLGWTVALLTLAGITDVLDGWVARTRHEVSELGKAIDPVADKLLIAATMLGLTFWGLPGWMLLVYLCKELIQLLAGLLLFNKIQQFIPANQWGKAATFTFFLGFGLFFLQHIIGTILIGVAILVSIIALYTYYRAYLQIKK